VGRLVLGGMKLVTLNLEGKDDDNNDDDDDLHLFGEQERP
jgi:hypothetical protein